MASEEGGNSVTGGKADGGVASEGADEDGSECFSREDFFEE